MYLGPRQSHPPSAGYLHVLYYWKNSCHQTSGCTVRGTGETRGVRLHCTWCKASCGSVPSQACPTRFPSWSHQAQSSPCVSQECWGRVFRFDSEWTLPPIAQAQTATSLHAGLGQCCSQAIQGLHNFWLCWLTHIPKQLRGQIDSGLSITKYYFSMHLWSHPTSKFQPREVRDVWRLQKKLWTAENERKCHGSRLCKSFLELSHPSWLQL